MAHGLISSKNTNKNKKIDKVKRSLTLRCLCQYCDPRYDWAGQCSEFRLSGLSASHVIIYCARSLIMYWTSINITVMGMLESATVVAVRVSLLTKVGISNSLIGKVLYNLIDDNTQMNKQIEESVKCLLPLRWSTTN